MIVGVREHINGVPLDQHLFARSAHIAVQLCCHRKLYPFAVAWVPISCSMSQLLANISLKSISSPSLASTAEVSTTSLPSHLLEQKPRGRVDLSTLLSHILSAYMVGCTTGPCHSQHKVHTSGWLLTQAAAHTLSYQPG